MADQDLKEAMEEIKTIMNRADIGGAVILSTENNLEYYYGLSPSWSIISIQDGEIKVKAQKENYASTEAQKKAVTDSANMALGIENMMRMMQLNMAQITRIFRKRFKIEFTMGSHEPHDPTPKK